MPNEPANVSEDPNAPGPAIAPPAAAPSTTVVSPHAHDAPPHSGGGKAKGVGAIAAGLVLIVAGVWLYRSMGTVSTDDAFVSGHVTFVAPRVSGQVTRVLVEDNNRVRA